MAGKKILIAEDEKPLSKALELKLSKEGFDVETAYDGEETVEKLTKDKFNLLLLDLVMPKKDGFQVLEDMLSKKISTPVIVVSNLGQDEDFKRTKKYGVKEYIVKADSSLENIVTKVSKFLN